ncbi:putative Syntaxin-12 [Hypsibius exemplaris]|uniref:Syntaxin-12 n=1 Tax=Hypsibius exemplaris TaxID=2072580 RepID=A0A1W0X698_HYPEX|nr:putative Syntaxin-12 [Hypsibius exemplaris]
MQKDYGSSGKAITSMEFGKLAQNVGSNIQRMSSQISDVERMVRQIGTPSDSTDLRERLHTLTHGVHDMAKQTGEMIKEMGNLPPTYQQTDQRQQKLLKENLVRQFSDALDRFQKAQRLAAQKERESVVRARAQSSNNAQTEWNPFEDGSQAGRAPPPPYMQNQTVLQVEDDVDIQALREREEAIRRLEADIGDVNQIFKDLAVLVHEQGEIIDSIEANVEGAQVHVEQGTTQLSEARRYQTKARKKMVCIIGVLAVAALVLALIIYFSVKPSS